MKKQIWLITLVVSLLCAGCANIPAKAAADSSAIQLRLDSANDSSFLPKGFRILPGINASGSSQFSLTSLHAVKDTLAGKNVTIVDLREESHGFADGMAVSWYGHHNAANKGKFQDDIILLEKEAVKHLEMQGPVSIIKPTAKAKENNAASKKNNILVTHVQTAMTEEDLTKNLGLSYYRLTVTDDHAPSDNKVDQFINFVRFLPPDTWLHFHCEAGHGRTTTFLAMYDMIRNAKTTGLNEIINQQYQAGGVNLFDTSQTGWKAPLAKERAEFLKQFYEYCRSNQDGFQTPWSTWRATHRIYNQGTIQGII